MTPHDTQAKAARQRRPKFDLKKLAVRRELGAPASQAEQDEFDGQYARALVNTAGLSRLEAELAEIEEQLAAGSGGQEAL
jgi:hypothetical protein